MGCGAKCILCLRVWNEEHRAKKLLQRCFGLGGHLWALLGVTPSCKLHVASSDVRLMSAALSPRWSGHGIESPQPCPGLETRPGRLGFLLSPANLSMRTTRRGSPAHPVRPAPTRTLCRHLPPPDLDISVLREGASPEFDVPSWPAGPRQFGVGRACSMGIKVRFSGCY